MKILVRDQYILSFCLEITFRQHTQKCEKMYVKELKCYIIPYLWSHLARQIQKFQTAQLSIIIEEKIEEKLKDDGWLKNVETSIKLK